LFRALENGMSVVRQVNEGTLMAVDYQGRLLACSISKPPSGCLESG
jgi:apolipoprotein N-acyltransferase